MKVDEMIGNNDWSMVGPDQERRAERIQENLLPMKIMYIGGIISSDQLLQFKRLVIRATRC
jgi:hypothetical protein